MKAKEWAAKINGAKSEDELMDLLVSLFRELFDTIVELKETRHVQRLSGMKGILLEVFQKYRSIAKRCPNIKPDGFEVYVRKQLPETPVILGEAPIPEDRLKK